MMNIRSTTSFGSLSVTTGYGTINPITGFSSLGVPGSGPANRFMKEVAAFFSTLFQPQIVIAEVTKMHALHTLANRVDATDPARAADLRRQAARVGLR